MNKEHIKPPGKILRDKIIYGNDLTIEEAAKLLGIARGTLSLIINNKCSITPEMSYRIEKVFNSDAKQWAMMQLEYDLENAKNFVDNLNLKPFVPK